MGGENSHFDLWSIENLSMLTNVKTLSFNVSNVDRPMYLPVSLKLLGDGSVL